ncbi:MAG: hypothetical protein Q7K57_49335 [Burkholderiaceae bacterium]|nr:hypothetical protein [Burkholderiaceae bacterium]
MTTTGYLIIGGYAALVLWLVYRGRKSGWTKGAERALAMSLMPAALALAIVVGVYLTGSPADASPQTAIQESQVGIDPNATRNKLRELSAVLVTADKKGDAQLAQTVLMYAVALQVTMQQQPDEKKSALRNCALAAKHLSTGAVSIKDGGRWLNEDQFQAAAGDCRT